MKKLPDRVKVSLLGCGLMLPLLIVCALTPAVSFFWQLSPGDPICALFHTSDCGPGYSAEDGLMFQVWWHDAVKTVQETDWALLLLNSGKAVLVVGAVVVAGIGLLLLLGVVLEKISAQDADSTGSEDGAQK